MSVTVTVIVNVSVLPVTVDCVSLDVGVSVDREGVEVPDKVDCVRVDAVRVEVRVCRYVGELVRLLVGVRVD